MALYKKERLAGLYGPNAFYFSLWISQTVLLFAYPIIVTGCTFYFLEAGDESWENFLQYILTGFLVSQVGANFGYMWGSLVQTENNAVISAIVYMMVSSLGAGQFVNLGNSGTLVKIIAGVSPVRYGVERIFRRLVSQSAFEYPLLQFFGFVQGDYVCAKTLATMAVTFWVVGWMMMIYKSNRI